MTAKRQLKTGTFHVSSWFYHDISNFIFLTILPLQKSETPVRRRLLRRFSRFSVLIKWSFLVIVNSVANRFTNTVDLPLQTPKRGRSVRTGGGVEVAVVRGQQKNPTELRAPAAGWTSRRCLLAASRLFWRKDLLHQSAWPTDRVSVMSFCSFSSCF